MIWLVLKRSIRRATSARLRSARTSSAAESNAVCSANLSVISAEEPLIMRSCLRRWRFFAVSFKKSTALGTAVGAGVVPRRTCALCLRMRPRSACTSLTAAVAEPAGIAMDVPISETSGIIDVTWVVCRGCCVRPGTARAGVRPRQASSNCRDPRVSPVNGSSTGNSPSTFVTCCPCRTKGSKETVAAPTCIAQSVLQTSTSALRAAKYSASWR
mmetsp:Transcript_43213/g.68346  ORF Transcript_43213/g.68346 Transcript_43213/m.68346 type:complete len:214 (+) Transcript_43213:1627-2268(+)